MLLVEVIGVDCTTSGGGCSSNMDGSSNKARVMLGIFFSVSGVDLG